MKKLTERIELEKSLAELEMEEFEQDMKYYNKKVTCRGYPFWHTHEAKKLLASDVKSGTKLNCLLSKVCLFRTIISLLPFTTKVKPIP
jgi:hypothetical protein